MSTDTTERIDRVIDTEVCMHVRTDVRIVDEGGAMVWSCGACGDGGITEDFDDFRFAPTAQEQADEDAARRAETMHVHQYDPWRGERRDDWAARAFAQGLASADAIEFGVRDAAVLRAYERDLEQGL